ncbi:MAG: NADP-dependent phosphogluconate dehydrogenase [Candidatus Magasanikbacteria bacterium]|nr:NADP-dependent phosphogluconate dehydrogenase [Candidatus Magasanikbacteria bacterium]
MLDSQSDLGLIGLAVMGSNLARNFASRGFSVSVYNRSRERTDEFIKEFGNLTPPVSPPARGELIGTYDYKTFVKSIKRSRKIMVMVKAGAPVDGVIADLLPHLEAGDIIIDGGNSNYRDTQRRCKELSSKGIHFVGCGVSGGEEGALKGPSIMPGGTKEAWKALKQYLEAIAAKDFKGKPCVTYVGDNGAGHYVKMVHNGIEYAVMQLLAEAYQMLRVVYKQKPNEIAALFKKYNAGKLNSFLFQIAVPVLTRKDDLKPGFLIDHILDRAGAKGTGAWTSADALERGIGIPSITEAVFARSISSLKDERLKLAKLYAQNVKFKPLPLASFEKVLENALYVAMISCYAQGYELIRAAAAAEGWEINLAEVSRIWEGGCIIRAKLLGVLHAAYQKSNLKNSALLAVPGIVALVKKNLPDLRAFVSYAGGTGVSTPSFSTGLFYLQDMTTTELPANMIQGLRDFFGAHTYERVDRSGNFHTNWSN